MAETSKTNKRGKMLAVSFFMTIAMFLANILGGQYTDWQIILFSVLGFITAYIAMIWVLGWEISKRSLLLFIPQCALFIAGEILFWFLFFSIGFDRISESLLLLVALSIFFFATYASFLMANIFTISSFRQIPLEQVAKTTSYVLSVFSAYLFTFSIFALELPFYITVPLLGVIYLVVLMFHAIHLGVSDMYFKKFLVVGWWSMLIATISFSFIAPKHELLALIPALVMYISVDLLVTVEVKRLSITSVLSYILLSVFVVVINFVI